MKGVYRRIRACPLELGWLLIISGRAGHDKPDWLPYAVT